MNISVISIRNLSKIIIRLILIIIILVVVVKLITLNLINFRKLFTFKFCSNLFSSIFYTNINQEKNQKIKVITKTFYPILGLISTNDESESNDTINKKDVNLEEIQNIKFVTENNIEESYNYTYHNIKIKNQSKYSLSDDMLLPNSIELKNKKIIIYHTHTCESYKASEKYNYNMTGNYRTIDCNFNVVKLGDELDKFLSSSGLTVIHNRDYHDYPAYNGSYERSLQTVEKIIASHKDAQIVIDLHRDAVGDGSWYGPTVEINGIKVAQMMFVIRHRWRRTNTS